MNSGEDVTTLVGGMDEEVKFHLAAFFTNTIILTEDMTIKVVSANLLDVLGYMEEDLVGKNIDVLAWDQSLNEYLRTTLQPGYFQNLYARIRCIEGSSLYVKMSGVNLAQLRKTSEFIVLKVELFQELTHNLPLLRNPELDDFIYRASHDLRGPLATMRGLINLLQFRKDDDKIDQLLQRMEDNALQMEDKLFRLFYISNTSLSPVVTNSTLSVLKLKNELTDILSHYKMSGLISLDIKMDDDGEIKGVNDYNVRMVLDNLILFLIGLTPQPGSGIAIQLKMTSISLLVDVQAKGFVVKPALRKAIARSLFMYSDVLKFPLLMNYHVASKLMQQMHGHLDVAFQSDHNIGMHLFIPKR